MLEGAVKVLWTDLKHSNLDGDLVAGAQFVLRGDELLAQAHDDRIPLGLVGSG